jgi:hypothetical protein
MVRVLPEVAFPLGASVDKFLMRSPWNAPQQLRIRKLTTNGTNHTNKLRTILTISALFITIIHIHFVFRSCCS